MGVWILHACRDVYPQIPCYSPNHSYIIRFVKKFSLERTVHPFSSVPCDGHSAPHASYHKPHLLPCYASDPALMGSWGFAMCMQSTAGPLRELFFFCTGTSAAAQQ